MEKTTDQDKRIYAYEWKKGQPRPTDQDQLAKLLVGDLEIPTGGEIPNVGDVIRIRNDHSIYEAPRWKIVARDFIWAKEDKGPSPARWQFVWLYVESDS